MLYKYFSQPVIYFFYSPNPVVFFLILLILFKFNQKIFVILMKPSLPNYSFMDCAVVLYLRNLCLTQVTKILFLLEIISFRFYILIYDLFWVIFNGVKNIWRCMFCFVYEYPINSTLFVEKFYTELIAFELLSEISCL